MRITVDGKPIDDPKRSSADIQRCTDVALAKVDIQFGYDNLSSAPRLSVAAQPSSTTVFRESRTAQSFLDGSFRIWDQDRASPIHFRMYTNYSSFVDRAEIRIFEPGRSPQSEPIDVVPILLEDTATWTPDTALFSARHDTLSYVLRAYGTDGNFDETQPQPLWVLYDQARPVDADELEEAWPDPDPALLAGVWRGPPWPAQHRIVERHGQRARLRYPGRSRGVGSGPADPGRRDRQFRQRGNPARKVRTRSKLR